MDAYCGGLIVQTITPVKVIASCVWGNSIIPFEQLYLFRVAVLFVCCSP